MHQSQLAQHEFPLSSLCCEHLPNALDYVYSEIFYRISSVGFAMIFELMYDNFPHSPHFFETCKPDALLTCTPGTIVYDFKCTNTDARFYNILDASQSFFSGHAASCVYSCTFIAWYLQRKIKATNIFMLPFIQSLLLALAYFGAISRVFDHRHHVIDVVAGGIVGVLTTAHAVSFLNFHGIFMTRILLVDVLVQGLWIQGWMERTEASWEQKWCENSAKSVSHHNAIWEWRARLSYSRWKLIP